MLVFSESKGTGWMATTDATAAFVPLKWTVEEPKFAAMIQALEETIALERDSLSPLQKAQYEIQLDWLRKGETPQVLFVMMSMGVINPEQGKSYFTMVSSVQVWHCRFVPCTNQLILSSYRSIHSAEDLWCVGPNHEVTYVTLTTCLAHLCE